MSRRRAPAGIRGEVLVIGNADDVVAELRAAALRDGIALVDPDAAEDAARAAVGIAAVRARTGSTLALGIRALDERARLLEPDAVRLVIAVRAKLPITPRRLMRPLMNEILFQVAVATGGLAGTRKLRRARARFGAWLLDAAGLHVFRVGRMRQRGRG